MMPQTIAVDAAIAPYHNNLSRKLNSTVSGCQIKTNNERNPSTGPVLDRTRLSRKMATMILNKSTQEQSLASWKVTEPAPEPQLFQAPDGLQIFHHALSETKYVYHEIFEDRIYFRHGINLSAGESVFDIGANIGLFTMFVEENFADIKVYAFEPSSQIFRVLKANVERYRDRVTTYNCGVAARCGEARFTFYPRYSIMSGFHGGTEEDKTALRAGIRSHLREQGIENPQERFVEMMLKQALQDQQEQVCRLESVSGVMDKERIGTLGLLKIDAEGSELDILMGIREEHWPGIRQIVMEVHDASGTKYKEIEEILTNKGYLLKFEQEQRLSGAGIVNCYASRARFSLG